MAALASWLDARAHHGQWLVRIEDVDLPRCIPGADHTILRQLANCGLHPDARPVWQSQRGALYQQALEQLIRSGAAYPCACSRKDIEVALAARGAVIPRHSELVYPGTCRNGLQGRTGRAWRLRTDLPPLHSDLASNTPEEPMDSAGADSKSIANCALIMRWVDRRLGPQSQNVDQQVGDFVLRRADGLWAYQLAVVVDDADQGVTHIVRGEDLADNTARQMLLQQHLSLRTPQYLHTPLVLGSNADKLSKQNGATALDTATPDLALEALQRAASILGLNPSLAAVGHIADFLAQCVAEWHKRFATPTAS